MSKLSVVLRVSTGAARPNLRVRVKNVDTDAYVLDTDDNTLVDNGDGSYTSATDVSAMVYSVYTGDTATLVNGYEERFHPGEGEELDQKITATEVTFTPSTAPTSSEGKVYYDETDGAVKVYNGSIWERISDDGVVDVRDYGAVGDGVADDTAAIQDAIAHVKTQVLEGNSGIYGIGGTYSGTTATLYFPSGVYKVTSALTPDTDNYLKYFNVVGERSLIVADAGVTVFGGVGYNNTFQGLVFRNGAVAISIKTANLDTTTININECEFQDQSSAHITTDATSQSTILNINQCKFMQSIVAQSFTFLSGDVVSISNSWITANSEDAAIYNNAERLNLTGLAGVPRDALAESGRWIDHYGKFLNCTNVRFGGERAGAPVVYNYTDLTTVTEYPWVYGHILIDGCTLYTGNASERDDAGVIIAKEGLPQSIQITNNLGKIDAPYINDQMTSGDLATYIATYTAAASPMPDLSILIQNNGVRPDLLDKLTNETAATTALMPYTMLSSASQTSGNTMYMQKMSAQDVSIKSVSGQTYPQTSTSSTISIVDTGIYFDTPIVGYGESATYEVFITGDPNATGSSRYRAISIGFINVITGYSGSINQIITYDEIMNKPAPVAGGLTVSAVFWDGATESTNVAEGSTTNQIRLKVDGYNSSHVGYGQYVQIVKRMGV